MDGEQSESQVTGGEAGTTPAFGDRPGGPKAEDLRSVVREAIEEFFKSEREYASRNSDANAEAALMKETALREERIKRESLEQRVNDLIAANEKARTRDEEAERSAAIRAELQRAGVAKLDLAYKAVQDEIYRSEDGRLVGHGGSELRDYIARFVGENPELLPARLAGGSGASTGQRGGFGDTGSRGRWNTPVDLDKIRPGMNPEELERVRHEIARVASQTLRGW